ncbi:nickel-responsive transcriptional regulator NikR [Puniceicoccus vermicola]|nr:nickel-responsive transcriptional regulator NikR [Puniceicoccus vermicola]
MSEPIERISLSMPRSLVRQLDEMIERRGFESRSQAISTMIHQQVAEHAEDLGNEVTTGTINIVYEHGRNNLKKRLAEIEYENIAEVISSLHILLESQQTLEVILVQGPASKLRQIANELISCKGVRSGTLNIHSAVIPQLHAKN